VYQRILVPLDGSDTAQLGLVEAINLAKSLKSRVRLIHIINDATLITPYTTGSAFEVLLRRAQDYGASVLQAAEAAVRDAGIAVDTQLIEANGGLAGDEIVRAAVAWPADLIVCGTHGRRGIRRLLMGSDAETVVRQCPVPVLLVRARSGKT